jgi:hypothetical protein
MGGFCRRHKGLYLRLIGDVGGHRQGIKFAGDGFHTIAIHVCQNKCFSALLLEPLGHCPANSAGSAGYNNGFVCDTHENASLYAFMLHRNRPKPGQLWQLQREEIFFD